MTTMELKFYALPSDINLAGYSIWLVGGATTTLHQLAVAACRKRKREKETERNRWKSTREN
jgi:hypothetical protein